MRTRLAAGFGALILSILAVSLATATEPNPDHKVTICHRTDANTHPYVRISVDIASSGFLKAGHDGHNGPVWNPGLKAAHIKWGDIIPPYTYVRSDGSTFSYAGKNWTAAGQAIRRNGCKVPSKRATPTPTPSECEQGCSTPTPTSLETPTPKLIETPVDTPNGAVHGLPNTAYRTPRGPIEPLALLTVLGLIGLTVARGARRSG